MREPQSELEKELFNNMRTSVARENTILGVNSSLLVFCIN